MQSVTIFCKWDKCPAQPKISAGNIFNGGKPKAIQEAIAIWNTRKPELNPLDYDDLIRMIKDEYGNDEVAEELGKRIVSRFGVKEQKG